MQRFLATAFLLAAGPAQAQEIDWNFRLTALEARVSALEVKNSAPQVIQAMPTVPTVIPKGFHAHTRTDGAVVVHADTNFGDPVAHAGIAPPWIRTGEAGQTAYTSSGVNYTLAAPSAMMAAAPGFARSKTVSVSAFGAGGCPGGVCPTVGFGTGPIRRLVRGW